jgi:hypothetical protein
LGPSAAAELDPPVFPPFFPPDLAVFSATIAVV